MQIKAVSAVYHLIAVHD